MFGNWFKIFTLKGKAKWEFFFFFKQLAYVFGYSKVFSPEKVRKTVSYTRWAAGRAGLRYRDSEHTWRPRQLFRGDGENASAGSSNGPAPLSLKVEEAKGRKRERVFIFMCSQLGRLFWRWSVVTLPTFPSPQRGAVGHVFILMGI